MNRLLIILLLNVCLVGGAPVTLPEKALADDCGEACGADVSLMQSSAVMSGRHQEINTRGEANATSSVAGSAASNDTEHGEVFDLVGTDVNDSSEADPVSEEEAPPPATKVVVDTTGAITAGSGGAWMALVVGLLVAANLVARAVPEEEGSAKNSAQYVAEFMGTFMLIFSVGCNVLVGDGTWAVVAIACTLMVMIYALGGVSGGNFNPAVSISLGFAGKMGWRKVCVYVMVQLAAGVAAGLAYGVMLGKTFNLGPSNGFTGLHAGLAELFYTFLLTFVVLNTACSKKHAGKEQFYGLAIGFSVVAGGYSGGAISGGCFNPAVALGIDASSSALGFGWCFHYWFFQVIGCFIAARLFLICRNGDVDAESSCCDKLPLHSKLVSEFLGTFMLVLTVGLNVLASSKAAVFSIAASLMCMIFALGSASGAHFNPAVTVACVGRGAIGLTDAFSYIGVQLVAGVCASLTYSFMHSGKTVALQPSDSFSQAMVGETVFTFLLAYVVLSVATTKSPLSEYFGLAIGSCVTAGGLAIGSLSGGSLNPAVSAGLAFTHGGASIGNFVAYSAAEIAGGCLASSIFRITHHREFEGKA